MTRVSIIVVRCINLAKTGIQQQRVGLAERARAWAGDTVVRIALDLCIFFFLSKNFGGLIAAPLINSSVDIIFVCWFVLVLATNQALKV